MMIVLRHPCLIMSATCSEILLPALRLHSGEGGVRVRGKEVSERWVREYVNEGVCE